MIDYMKLDGMVIGGMGEMRGETWGNNAMRRRHGEPEWVYGVAWGKGRFACVVFKF